MATQSTSTSAPAPAVATSQTSWLALIVIALAQILIVFNGATLSVSTGAVVADFKTPVTTVQTTLVVYSLVAAAFIILGGKLGALFGPLRVFRGAVILLGVAMVGVALSPSPAVLLLAEAVAGLGVAALVPTLIALIVANYEGKQQALAIGALGAAAGIGGSLALLIAGGLGSAFGWRVPFWLIVALAGLVLVLSMRLQPAAKRPGVTIDWVGVLLSVGAVIALIMGLNGIGAWGLLLAKPAAPFSLLGLSPSLILIVAGVLLGQGFFAWQHRRVAETKTPLLSPQVLDSPTERTGAIALLILTAVGAGFAFLLPLYIQIVQGKDGLQTALNMLPYAMSVFAAAILVTRLLGPMSPRQIARYAFVLMAAGLFLTGVAVQNEWSNLIVIVGLILTGLGQGALTTALGNVLVSASPRELAGEVGALRGTTSYLGAAMGPAVVGALLIGVLSSAIGSSLTGSTVISPEIQAQVDLDSVAFVSNDQLTGLAQGANATAEQVTKAVLINAASRLQALKISFFALAALALLAIIPAGGLPGQINTAVPPGALLDATPTGKKAAGVAA